MSFPRRQQVPDDLVTQVALAEANARTDRARAIIEDGMREFPDRRVQNLLLDIRLALAGRR
jgi:hypothetical protein